MSCAKRGKDKKMAKGHTSDPYRRLTKWMIALLILLVLFATGYVLLDQYQKGEHARLQAQVDEKNAQLIAEHDAAQAALDKELSQKEVKEMPAPAAGGWDIIDASAFPVGDGEIVTSTRLEALSGGLLLLNRWHELPGDFGIAEQTLKSVGEETAFRVPVSSRAVSLFPAAIASLDTMIKDAGEQGLMYYIVRQGYRTMATQTEFWNKELARHPNRTGTGLIEAARQAVSFPGTSDYQSGFSFELDVYSRDDSVINATDFQTTDQARFVNDNGWKYGIIFRYPMQSYPYPETVDKSYVTGMNPGLKLDTYRYVGIPHAAVMHIEGLCLEEYIDYLVEHPHIFVYEDGAAKFEIYRVPETGVDQPLQIPAAAASYTVSTDNMGGLICAITY